MLERIAMVAGAAVSITMAQPARAQADTLQRPDTALRVNGLKSPLLAEAFGVFPGGGLMYAGAWTGGVGTFVATPLLIAGGAFVIDSQGCAVLDWSCQPHYSARDHVIGSAMIAAGVALWSYEAINAGRIVRRDNATRFERARRTALTDVQPFVTTAPSERGRAVALGVHATW